MKDNFTLIQGRLIQTHALLMSCASYNWTKWGRNWAHKESFQVHMRLYAPSPPMSTARCYWATFRGGVFNYCFAPGHKHTQAQNAHARTQKDRRARHAPPLHALDVTVERETNSARSASARPCHSSKVSEWGTDTERTRCLTLSKGKRPYLFSFLFFFLKSLMMSVGVCLHPTQWYFVSESGMMFKECDNKGDKQRRNEIVRAYTDLC